VSPSLLFSKAFDTDTASLSVVHFLGDALIVRTTRYISENEELTIAYVDPSLNFEARKEALKKVGYAAPRSGLLQRR
jgi:hypothetical protein